jgi:hypothetical protein
MDVMRQALISARLLLLLYSCGMTYGAAPAPQSLDEARTLVEKREYKKAAAVLEEGLSASTATERSEMIDLLRHVYQNLIIQAEAANKPREAAEYRDNLAILGQAPGKPTGNDVQAESAHVPQSLSASPAPAATKPLSVNSKVPRLQGSSPNADPLPFKELSPLPEPSPSPALEGPGSGTSNSHPVIPPPNRVATRGNSAPRDGDGIRQAGNTFIRPETGKSPPTPTDLEGQTSIVSDQPMSINSELAQADQWFADKKYSEAGQTYARLAVKNQLPPQRQQVWAYCRWVAVVALINSHPHTDREWDDIEQEIRSIQKLTPGNWYGEYLLSRVAEARRKGRGSARNGKLVVRGSAPDENPTPRFPRLLARAKPPTDSALGKTSGGPAEEPFGLPAAASQDSRAESASADSSGNSKDPGSDEGKQPASPAGARADQESSQEGDGRTAAKTRPARVPLSWHVRETPNFRIYYTDPAVAEKAAQAAESVRTQQARRWGSSAARTDWSPPCDIYLYPTPKDFAQLTGQPETSPGFSTMGVNSNRIVSRRVNLRGDHPQLLSAILPHEVTHVVLADLFTEQQIPRWADEGMAVLAEPRAEQVSRASELSEPLRNKRVFKLSELMAIDYPSADAWNLYYAQSVSLTQFLVELGSPEQFVGFVRGAQRRGVEIALRESYQIDGFTELENRWQSFARHQAEEIATSRRNTPENDSARRR